MGVGTSSSSPWELIRNADFQIPPRPTELKTLNVEVGNQSFNLPGDLNAGSD